MSYKDIIIFLDDRRSCRSRVRIAAEIAAWQRAHLIGITIPMSPKNQGDIGAVETYARGTGMDDFILHSSKNDASAYKSNMQYLERNARTHQLGMEWRTLPFQSTVRDVALHCRYSDLVILPQAVSHNSEDLPFGWTPEELILTSGVPCLFIPDTIELRPFHGRVVIAWNASREVRRAVADAMPFLQAAQEVIILIIDPRIGLTGHGDDPGADIARHLAHHGVRSTIEIIADQNVERSDGIIRKSREFEASLLVIGAYGHSGVMKFVIGSATQKILLGTTIPVLCSH